MLVVDPASLAVEGIGFGPMAVATLGYLTFESDSVTEQIETLQSRFRLRGGSGSGKYERERQNYTITVSARMLDASTIAGVDKHVVKFNEPKITVSGEIFVNVPKKVFVTVERIVIPRKRPIQI